MQHEVFLETERLIFRKLTPDDARFLHDLDSDPEVMRFLTGGQPTPLARIEEEILPRLLRFYDEFENLGYWAVHEKASGDFLGWFHFRPAKEVPEEIELGYRLKRSVWGKGYATEGSRALIDKAFNEWGIEKVVAMARAANTGSRRVMEKCGMRLEREFVYGDDPPAETSVKYVVTADDFARRSEDGPGETPRPPGIGTAELRILVPLLLIVVLCSWAFPALDQYNVTWDEALGDFFFGERYLSFFTSGDAAYLDFLENPYPPERRPDLFVSPFKGRPWEYYPVANVLAASVSTVLSRWLGWLDPFDGFHALNVLLAAVFLWVFHRFLAAREGLVAATAAAVLVVSSPRVFCHMMANIKDFPLMVFFTVTALATFRALEKGSVRGLLGAGVLLGLTLATKGNALFFPAIPVLLLAAGGPGEVWQGRRRQLLLGLLAAGAVAVTVMVVVWPYLWSDPVGRYGEHLRYIGLRQGYTRAESMAPVLEAVLLTTPLPFLLLFAAGLVPCARRALRRDRLAIFFLAWIAVVLGRFLLPQAVNFDGVRHFLELFPALAAVAGMGLTALLGQVRRLVPALGRRRFRAAFLGLALAPGAWAVVASHPFQIAWWNALGGGPAGAYARGLPQAGDYWGMSYRLGLDWLNENAPRGSYLAVPVVEHAVRLVAPERLREDIVLLPVTVPFSPRIAPERLARTRELARTEPLYVMFVERRDWANELMVDCLRFFEPEAVWRLDGAPVLAIYRYRWPPRGPTAPGP